MARCFDHWNTVMKMMSGQAENFSTQSIKAERGGLLRLQRSIFFNKTLIISICIIIS